MNVFFYVFKLGVFIFLMYFSYIIIVIFCISYVFLIFLKEVRYAQQDCIYLIKNTEKNIDIVKYYSNLIWIYFKM